MAELEYEKLKLEALEQNLLVRVQRSAAHAGQLSTWMTTGAAAVFVLAVNTEISSPSVTVGPLILSLLALAAAASFLGAVLIFCSEYLNVGFFSAARDATDNIVRLLIERGDKPVSDEALKSLAAYQAKRENLPVCALRLAQHFSVLLMGGSAALLLLAACLTIDRFT